MDAKPSRPAQSMKSFKVAFPKEARNIAEGSSATRTIKSSMKPHSHYMAYFQNSESNIIAVLCWKTNLSACQSGFWGNMEADWLVLCRQSPCNWGKSTQTLFCISIRPYFRPRKSYPRSLQNNKERMVRPWVKVSLSQYEKLNRLKEETGKPLSEIIRKAVCDFVRKKDFTVSTTVSYLPKGTRDKYKSVSAYLPRSDWNLLEEISKNTGECKSEFIRQAVDEYVAK